MKYTNLLEKLLLIFNIIASSTIYIVFIGIVLLTVFLLLRKKISKKKCFLINLLSIVSLVGYTIYNNYTILTKIFDNIMNNIFTNIYFPSTYTYLFILILVNVIGITSLLKVTINRTYKSINGTFMLLINFILVLILEIISKEEIDLFSKSSLFSNSTLVMLLEFSINIFIVWIISLTIVYLTNIISERKAIISTNKELKKKPAITTPLEVTIDNYEDEYLNTNNKFIPKELINSTPLSQTSNQYKFIPVIENNTTNNKIDNNFDLSSLITTQNNLSTLTNNIIENNIPLIKEETKPNLEEERDTYTLNDYRIFNKMLKDIKEHNASNIITIDKNLEYRLITKYSTEKYDMFKKMLKIYSN